MSDRDWTPAEARFGPLAPFIADERGATAIEYSLIAALIFLVVVAAITTTGADVGGAWDRMAQKVITNLGG
jgi:pilus assembly protein Flp/PilA